MFNVPLTDADTLLNSIKDVLIRCTLPLEQCRGQGYDGASNMMGRLNGVAKKFQETSPSALPVHCLAHCTNLVLQDLCKSIKTVQDALNLTKEISRLIKFSPKREIQFVRNQINASGHLESGQAATVGPSIKPLCPTRWTVRTGAIEAVLKNYSVLQETMIEVNTSQHDDNGIAAGGISALMDKFQTFWGLKLSHLLFSATEQLSLSIQGKDTSAQEAQIASKAARAYYQRLRKAEEFKYVYQEVVKEAACFDLVPSLPRYRKRPK